MRIIAGTYKGRKVIPPQGDGSRPTLDRVKEALFSTLVNDIEESTFADLFAGSGSIGIEALSRGAEHVIFAESNDLNRKIIKKNCETILFEEDLTHFDIFDNASFFFNNPNCKESFDLLFLDPPYNYLKTLVEEKTLASFFNNAFSLVKENGILILEAPDFFYYSLKDENIIAYKERKYGKIHLLYFYR
ncbi:MAG: 16S rRNA (guanine(966)-N(2))-methyltransferase RsmD [Candidatus Aureabacteria bacterium]|nr:16S rRNA (guanine(966)-N(2))-methyltransferase RsmD [Candidatus Auribacterota bacterium]